MTNQTEASITPDVSGSFIDLVLTAQTPARRSVNVQMSSVMSHYIPTLYDSLLADEMDHLLDNIILELGAQPGAQPDQEASRGGRVLTVQGPAGTGKTSVVNRMLKGRPEFGGLVKNEVGAALLTLVAPSPTTSPSLAAEFLAGLGYPCPSQRDSSPLWLIVRRQLKERGIRVVHIDEMQHAGENSDPAEASRVASSLKRVLEDKTWPVWLILSGLPEVSRFLQDDPSMRRRIRTVVLGPMTFPEDVEAVRHVINEITERCPGMDIGKVTIDEFVGRLLKATLNRFGVVVEYIQDAVKLALSDNRMVLEPEDFADVYAARTGVTDNDQNPFLIERWHEVDVARAMYEEKVEAGMAKQRLKRAPRLGDTR